MNHWFDCNFKVFLLCTGFPALLFCTPLYAENINSDNELIQQIALLENEFKTLSYEFYQDSSSYADESLKTISDITQLKQEVNRLMHRHQEIAAIRLLHFNSNTLKNNLEDEAIFEFTELLLEKNEWDLANVLLREIKKEGDNSLVASMQFIFAKYHADRNEWSQVNNYLQGIFAELSPEDYAYAYLLNGSSLQHLKKHRLAIKSYNKIPASSQYYIYARLNTAIANIRQDWLSDAQITINDLIKKTQKDNSNELTNRLYLVLGYALLQKEYYRDAREAFRHIGLDSRYTNRALLGIGLTATSQGDYVGGLNALSILKNKKAFDLSIDESYLLIPYVYEKLQQELTVTASYTEAINYYQRRISRMDSISNQHTDFSSVKYDDKTSSIIIQGNNLEYGKHYPVSFINNYHHLIKFLLPGNNTNLNKKIKKLISKHDKVFQGIIGQLAGQRKEYLKSYLNQSRYGLARLFDNSNEASN